MDTVEQHVATCMHGEQSNGDAGGGKHWAAAQSNRA